MHDFSTISVVKLNDGVNWNNRLFLTLDIDWANDEVLDDTIDLVEQADVAATWFVTHKTSVLERLKETQSLSLEFIQISISFCRASMMRAKQLKMWFSAA